MKRLRLIKASLWAFIIGLPMAAEAKAQAGDIVGSSLGLAFAIADVAGDS